MDIAKFYHYTDGADLFSGEVGACRIVAEADIEPLPWARFVEYSAFKDDGFEGTKGITLR